MDERSRLRLINLTSLLDSPIEGERMNALAAANRLLERSGLRWRDINRALGDTGPRHAPPRQQRAYEPPPRSAGIGDKAAEDLMAWLASLVTREGVRLSAWEADFCNDIYDRLEEGRGSTRITDKQWDVINRIKKKNGDA